MATYIFENTDAFPILDVGDTSQKYQSISDSLILSDTFQASPTFISVPQQLFISQKIAYHFSIKNASFADTLALTETFGPTKEYRFTDTLVISSIGEQYGDSEDVSDTLEFIESLSTAGSSRTFPVIDTLVFREVIYKNLFRGSSPLPIGLDVTTIDSQIRNAILDPDPVFCYPPEFDGVAFTGLGSVILPRPDFNNKDTINVARVNVRSRGNELIIFAPDYWSKDHVIDYDFNIYDGRIVFALQQFIDNNLGKMVTLQDHEGNSWRGVILTGALDVKMHNFCHWTTSLSFQKFV